MKLNAKSSTANHSLCLSGFTRSFVTSDSCEVRMKETMEVTPTHDTCGVGQHNKTSVEQNGLCYDEIIRC